MKKLFLLVVLMLTACDPPEYTNCYYGWFYFRNSTENEFVVHLSIDEDSKTSDYDDALIVPGKSEIIYWYNPILVYDAPVFKDFLVVDTITVCDNNGKELIKYIQGEIKEGQRDVFDEKEWSYTENPDELTYIWEFNITEEDIRRSRF